MILSTLGGLVLEERPAGPLTRAGLYARTIGGPGGQAELDGDEVEDVVETLQDWLERNGRRR